MKDTKKRILKASQELFSKFGYKKVSVDEIVYNANLAKGTFYIYFSSKESLYRELIEINIKTLIAPKLIEYLKNEKDLQILMYKKNILGLHMINKNTLLKELFLHNPNYASEQMNYKRIEALNKDVSISILKRIKTEIRSDLSFSSITKISAWIFQIMLNIKMLIKKSNLPFGDALNFLNPN